MYKITLTLENPMSGLRKAMVFQFDPESLDQTKWNTAFPAVEAKLDELVSESAVEGKEPATW